MGEQGGFITEYVAVHYQLLNALAMPWRVLPEVREVYLLTEEYDSLEDRMLDIGCRCSVKAGSVTHQPPGRTPTMTGDGWDSKDDSPGR
jgi:hypothetical protein